MSVFCFVLPVWCGHRTPLFKGRRALLFIAERGARISVIFSTFLCYFIPVGDTSQKSRFDELDILPTFIYPYWQTTPTAYLFIMS